MYRILGAALAIVVALAAIPGARAETATVGSFVRGLAQARALHAADPAAAVSALAAAGVRLPDGLDLSKPLTEADVVALSRAAGLRVSTSSPDRAFDGERTRLYFELFSEELSGGAVVRGDEDDQGDDDGPLFDPFSKGKGKGKQPITPTEP